MKENTIKIYKAIGYWRGEEQSGLPDPAQFIDTHWDKTEKQAVIDYLKKGETVAEYRGWSWCRFGCPDGNGSADMTDGTYIYPEGLVHYIDQHPFYIFLELISQIRRIATLIENIKQAGIKCRRYGTWALVQPYGF